MVCHDLHPRPRSLSTCMEMAKFSSPSIVVLSYRDEMGVVTLSQVHDSEDQVYGRLTWKCLIKANFLNVAERI